MKEYSRRALLLVGSVGMSLFQVCAARAADPVIAGPIIVVMGADKIPVRSATIQIRGSALGGDALSNSKLTVDCFSEPEGGGNRRRYRIFSRRTSSRYDVFRWTDTQIVVKAVVRDVEDGCVDARITLKTPSGEISDREVEMIFQYDRFPLPPDGATANPLALAQDANGDIWINSEFAERFYVWRAALEHVAEQPIDVITPVPESVFAGTPKGWGEDVLVDVPGDEPVWFGQSGTNNYSGPLSSQTRLVSYKNDASGDAGISKYPISVNSVPMDRQPIVGLALQYEPPNIKKIWFATGDPTNAANSRISSFDLTSQSHPVTSFPIGNETNLPSHLVVNGGYIWFESHFYGGLGRLDPTTGQFKLFPVPPSRTFFGLPNYPFAGGWSLIADPDSATGDLIFDETGVCAVGRFHTNLIDTLGCESLTNGVNPCMDIVDVPMEGDGPNAGPNPDPSYHHWIHSAALDAQRDEIWYTYSSTNLEGESGTVLTPDDQMQSVGFMCDNLAASPTVITLPPLFASYYDYRDVLRSGTRLSDFSGILVDHDGSGSIWIAGYTPRDIGRLSRIKFPLDLCPNTQ